MGQLKGKPRASILTFWTKKRIENGLTLTDLSLLTEINYSTLSKELTGEKVMPVSHITKLCGLFGVELDEGAEQAKKAYCVWRGAHNLAKDTSEKPSISEAKPITPVPVTTEETFEASDDILRKVYGNIPYDDFLTIQEKGVGSKETLRILYDKIDFDNFMKLLDVI